MKPIIEVKDIGKKYKITHQRGKYVALRDVIAQTVQHPLSFLKDKALETTGLKKKEEFWALRNITFTVDKGEVVGVIGHNGAGKSTLLKILSQITPPTEGEIILRGRVGSLLEVGTGFHPELTGRENIFLNGAILGMHRLEIAQKFDQIVDFAGIEKFLDTPVKFYSSGMYVRLAFSVAAHMEPEILVVDEVLAVGDAEFQKKCLGKMDEITRQDGRTILFVSHNLGAIRQLCGKTLLLKDGHISFFGPTDEALKIYEEQSAEISNLHFPKHIKRRGDGRIRFTTFHVEDTKGQIITATDSGSPLKLVFGYECSNPSSIKNIDVGFSLHKNDRLVAQLYSSDNKKTFDSVSSTGHFEFTIDKVNLASGRYNIQARMLANGIEADWPSGMIGTFEVRSAGYYGEQYIGSNKDSIVMIDGSWSNTFPTLEKN
jgi:lipopolysaccharide transport system ATP-binding protein